MPNVTTCLLGNIADTAIAAVWNWFCSQSNLIVTDHISWQSTAIGRARLSICFHSRFWTNWSLTLISSACVSLWVKTICAWDQGWIYSKRGLCSEKMWGPLIYEYPVTPPPRLPSPDTVGADTHSSHHRHFVEDPCCSAHYYCSSSWRAVWGQKCFCPFVGPPFCGAPVRPNMLNMPKSASAWDWQSRS